MKLPPEQEAIRAKCFHPSGTFVEFPKEDVESSIPERFQKIVQKYSSRLAVKVGSISLTYEELNRHANCIAQRVLELCGDRLNPVLVLTDHDINAIAASLGVLKAGKILVAADPSFPTERLEFMADDTKTEVILTCGANLVLATRLQNRNRLLVNLDQIDHSRSIENIHIERQADDPALIRYTSGSTGRPKGAIRSHRRNLFTAMSRVNSTYLNPLDRVIVLRRLSFNTGDTFNALLAGAAAFPFDIKQRGISGLADFLRAEEITFFVSTPSIFRYFAQEITQPSVFPKLRLIKLGGEPLFRTDVDLYKRIFPDTTILLNQLSGSEMGNICQFWISKDMMIESAVVPVGYPVENKQVLILDDSQQEVDGAEVGEIAVASHFLSTGYLNDSTLTNEKFLIRQNESRERLYLSGDLGRRLPNGCLIHLGRKDDQVKIRGAKVEIREVEAVLLEHPQVKQATVVDFDSKDAEKYLTGYVVPVEQTALNATAINSYLRKRLPEYMIPSAYVFLDELPLINGKINRRSLPKPNTSRPKLDTAYTQARNDTEAQLVKIWEEVLDVHPIGIHDNFFDLGGHSLAATRVVSRVIRQFQLEIPLQSLFQSPTVADMAAVITAHHGKALDEQGLAAVLDELEALSDEDAEQLLGKRHHDNSKA